MRIPGGQSVAVLIVQRLNSVLSQYQKKYLPPSPEDEQVQMYMYIIYHTHTQCKHARECPYARWR